MGQRTPLYELHVEENAKIVDFGGWDMPVHYGSQVEEHHAVRGHAGMFDVSHMTVVDIQGEDSEAFLDRLLANDIRKLTEGKALYSAMLNESGKVLDDLIVYKTGKDYLMVVNCATRDKDLAWLEAQSADFACTVLERPELAIVAVQGPEAIKLVSGVHPDAAEAIKSLKLFQGTYVGEWFVAKTGYTGERGVEIVLPARAAVDLWQALKSAGVSPIGLGARDTLRLEAGMNLYGSDMDESVTPLESNMASTVVFEGRDFIGRSALLQQQSQGGYPELIGLVMEHKGVMRAHYAVLCDGQPVGEITSGAFSPTLGHSIALARVTRSDGELQVQIRNKPVLVKAVIPPFVRNGKKTYKER